MAAADAPPDLSTLSLTLPVLPDEEPWSASELAHVHAELSAEVNRLTIDLQEVQDDLNSLLPGSSSAGGEDTIDVGTASFEAVQEAAVATEVQETLASCQKALQRIADATYGVCEGCQQPIGKARMQALPRARKCIACKQAESRL